MSRPTAEERLDSMCQVVTRPIMNGWALVNGAVWKRDAVKAMESHAKAEVEAATAELRRERDNSERGEGVALAERDRYEDVIQEVHVALGGSGEWAARSGCDHVEGETGDLCADVLVLAARVVRERDEAREEVERLRNFIRAELEKLRRFHAAELRLADKRPLGRKIANVALAKRRRYEAALAPEAKEEMR